MNTRIIVIAGPTASGKSALALGLAERLGGTIINADSMQIYRDLEIVTARPAPADLARAPHRLYGILDGGKLCSAARWAGLARHEIEQAAAAGRLPILCGGTGLYLRTLLYGIAPVPEIPEAVRQAARQRHAELGGAAFRDELAGLDPAGAVRIAAGDSQRLLRAYEVVAATGRPLTEWQQAQPSAPSGLDPLIFTLLPPREALYAAIDARFAGMVAAGVLDEVRALIGRGLDPALPVMKAVGVPELAAYLAGNLTLDAAISQAQQASRRYAKRQFTWFRHQMPAAQTFDAQYSVNFISQICQIICNVT
ncbi:MAG: tRNA dimethylallyltransferase [Aliidongia sp.]|nr:tRNA dimethylallyltransferase [Aliidongia sp.]